MKLMQLIADQQLHLFTRWINVLKMIYFAKIITLCTISHYADHWPCVLNTCTGVLCGWVFSASSCVFVCICVYVSLACVQYVGWCKLHQGSHPMIMLHNTLIPADRIALFSSPCQPICYAWDSFKIRSQITSNKNPFLYEWQQMCVCNKSCKNIRTYKQTSLC